MTENKNVILSARDIVVEFDVRDRVLTAIRGVSLDLVEGEVLALVGESGSGKSVLTKTFTGMLEENGRVLIVTTDFDIRVCFVKLAFKRENLLGYNVYLYLQK